MKSVKCFFTAVKDFVTKGGTHITVCIRCVRPSRHKGDPIHFRTSVIVYIWPACPCSAIRRVLCNVPVWKMMPIELSSSATLNHIVKFKYSPTVLFLFFQTGSLFMLLAAVIVLSTDTVGGVQLVVRFVSATVTSTDSRFNSHLPTRNLSLCSMH